jgi:hypothetical protein
MVIILAHNKGRRPNRGVGVSARPVGAVRALPGEAGRGWFL